MRAERPRHELLRNVSAERFFDDLARTLAQPMPRRRAVRVIGVSFAALAVPGLSPAVGRAGLDQATCPDGSKCRTAGDVCCTRKSPVSGGYVCRRPSEVCCCGNTACDAVTERCICPAPGGAGGMCAPKCALTHGPNWTNCGVGCCRPHEECRDGECFSCEDQGERSCWSYNQKVLACCPGGEQCCANMTSVDCCGPKQICRAAGRRRATCVCTSGRKCGPDCCKRNETCCGGKECCTSAETCCGDHKCCKDGSTCCGGLSCCDEGDWCLHKATGTIFNVPTCKPTCAPGNRAGRHCCGTGYRPNRTRTNCVPE